MVYRMARVLARVAPHGDAVTGVQFAVDGTLDLLTACLDGLVRRIGIP